VVLVLGGRNGGELREEGAAGGVSLTWTCRTRICVGRHCTLRLLQHPEQRCTSTQGGHTTKLALVLSTMLREISKTTARVLHSASTAGSAAARASMGSQEKKGDERGFAAVTSPLQPPLLEGIDPTRLSHTHTCPLSSSHPSSCLPGQSCALWRSPQ